MVLTKSELINALQNEVRILLHLAGKIDRTQLDYRPTPKQRSTFELLRYLSMMGPTLVQYAKAETPDPAVWAAAAEAAEGRDFDETLAAIAAQTDEYATLLGDVTDVDAGQGGRVRRQQDDTGGGHRQHGAVWVCSLPDAAVSVSEGVWAGRAGDDEPLGRCRSAADGPRDMNLGAFSVRPAVKDLQRGRRASTRSSGSRWSVEAQGAGWRVRGSSHRACARPDEIR